MTDRLPPCADPANDPQDWFISANGKQYSFDRLLTDAEDAGIRRSVLWIRGESERDHAERVEAAVKAAEDNRKALALRRRQAAKSKCYACPIRVECGRGAVERGEMHGTWGGLFEEELSEVITLHRRRIGVRLP